MEEVADVVSSPTMLQLQRELTEQTDLIRNRLINDPEEILREELLSDDMFDALGNKSCTHLNFGHAIEASLDRYRLMRGLNDKNFPGNDLTWTRMSNAPHDWFDEISGFKVDIAANTYRMVKKHYDRGNDMVITYKPLSAQEVQQLINFIKNI